jgi:hypothetical protein
VKMLAWPKPMSAKKNRLVWVSGHFLDLLIGSIQLLGFITWRNTVLGATER